ncbi:transcriptional regulator [Microbacterium sp. Root61]|nr:transcriptional regulator [Microbacterium sp. Root61]
MASHAVLTSPHPLSFIWKVVATALAVVLVSAVGVAGFTFWYAANAVAGASVDIGGDDQLPPTLGEIEGGVNILLVGTDSCEGQDIAQFPRCAEDDGGERNDVTMLVHISDEPRRITVVSFPRDMLVPIPSCPDSEGGSYSAMSEQMLNASYMYGGLPCTVLTVEKLTEVDIDFAAAIRWTGVIKMSDAIGGVDVCVAEDISDGHTGLNLTAGEHTLVGAEALQFLRIRHGIGDGSDLGRISNQQQFMGSLVRKLQGDGVLADPQKLFALATTAVAQVDQKQLLLSSGLANPTRMVQIAMAAKSVPYDDILFVQYPTEYSDDFLRLYPVRESAQPLFDALRDNKPIQLTGKASSGSGVEVVGEAEQPTTPTTETPAPGATAPVVEERVQLPSDITGQSAKDITCTQKGNQ